MRTYYRGPDALVTDERFVWRTSSPRIFAVSELQDVVLVRMNHVDRRPDAATVGAGVITALAVVSWALVGPVVGAAVGFVAITVAAGALATRHHRVTHSWQVRATYRGIDKTVYVSHDVRVFNQVTRALRRSIEDDRPTRQRLGLAAA